MPPAPAAPGPRPVRSSDGRRRELERDAAARRCRHGRRRRLGWPRSRPARRPSPIRAMGTARSTPSADEPDRRRTVEPPAAGPRVGAVVAHRSAPPPRRPRRRPGSRVRSAQSSGGQMRSSVSVRAAPSRTTGWRTSQRRNRRFVTSPRTTVSSSAAGEPVERLVARPAPGDDLGQHRVEPAADLGPELDPGIDPDPVAGRPAERARPARSRQEPGLGVLGVEADLDRRGPSAAHVVLREPERLARGDPELVGHEVAAGDELRDRVLDLEPRVHLEEGGRPAVVDQELAGPRARRSRPRAPGSAPPRRAGRGAPSSTAGRRRLLEDLLVAALDRAVALAEVDAVRRGHRTGPGSRRGAPPSTSRSRISRSSPKAAVASRRAAASASASALGVADGPHPLAAAAGRRLDQQRDSRSARPRRSGRASDWSGSS